MGALLTRRKVEPQRIIGSTREQGIPGGRVRVRQHSSMRGNFMTEAKPLAVVTGASSGIGRRAGPPVLRAGGPGGRGRRFVGERRPGRRGQGRIRGADGRRSPDQEFSPPEGWSHGSLRMKSSFLSNGPSFHQSGDGQPPFCRAGGRAAVPPPRAPAAETGHHGRSGVAAGDDVAELVPVGDPELGEGPVQVRADRARR